MQKQGSNIDTVSSYHKIIVNLNRDTVWKHPYGVFVVEKVPETNNTRKINIV